MTRSMSRSRAGFESLQFGRRQSRRMGDERLQPRRKAFDFRRPVGEQRCRRHQQARLRPGAILALENEQQRKHLNGLAESHIVGKTGSETEFREEIKPAHADLLVGPQHALQRIAGVDLRQPLRTAQPLQGLRQPGAGDHLRPVGVGRGAHALGVDIRAGQQPHGLAEGQAVVLGRALRFAEARDDALQVLAVEFDPPPSHQREPIRPSQQIADFGGCERFTIERDFHMEIEQRVLSQSRRRLSAHGAGDSRPRGTIAPPRRRHANHHARRLQVRDVAQKLPGLTWRPAQRMKDFTGVDHGLQPRARLRRALHRNQQGQEAFLVGRARVLAQRLPQRQMLRLGLRR